MHLSYLDIDTITPELLVRSRKKLHTYRAEIARVKEENDSSVHEYALVHVKQPSLHDTLTKLRVQFKSINHLVLIGIGGQDLGVKAVHEALGTTSVTLHALDMIAPYQVRGLLAELAKVKNLKQIAIMVSSKSGATTETLINAGVLLSALEKQYGKGVYERAVFIGSAGSDFLKAWKRLGATAVNMPHSVGGRYSVTTEAGLVPLTMLGHDVDSFMEGILDATHDQFESIVIENAVRLHHYITKGYRHYNFFAFEPRLYKLGAWYRQLSAESLGKATTISGKPFAGAFLPTISTPIELHSIGQLYLSGFPGVYTDFVTFDDAEVNFNIPKQGLAKQFGKFDMQEVATALYGGVMGAYQEKKLPYRSTILQENLPYELGLFMGMRMLETMYIAKLLDLNAFDQPNVELYKTKTRDILGL